MMMPPRSMATAGRNGDSVWSRRENSIMHDETETKDYWQREQAEYLTGGFLAITWRNEIRS
jgi:hypothetical protein